MRILSVHSQDSMPPGRGVFLCRTARVRGFAVSALQLDAGQLRRTLRRLAHEILERTRELPELVFVGVRTRGVPLAERLADELGSLSGVRPPVGALDVTLYRDDLNHGGGARAGFRKTELPFSCADKDVVLVDDVLYTGRTARAALAALVNFGRPRRVRLAILVDRGGRELPIRADFVGKNVEVVHPEEVRVCLRETDGEDAVFKRTTSGREGR